MKAEMVQPEMPIDLEFALMVSLLHGRIARERKDGIVGFSPQNGFLSIDGELRLIRAESAPPKANRLLHRDATGGRFKPGGKTVENRRELAPWRQPIRGNRNRGSEHFRKGGGIRGGNVERYQHRRQRDSFRGLNDERETARLRLAGHIDHFQANAERAARQIGIEIHPRKRYGGVNLQLDPTNDAIPVPHGLGRNLVGFQNALGHLRRKQSAVIVNLNRQTMTPR